MFKITVVILAIIACVAAKPGLLHAPLAYSVPAAAVVAAPAPFVTATSSQVIARNFNGIATAPIIAPATFAAPLTYSSPLAYTSPFAAPIVHL